MNRGSFCEWIPILPWPVWPLAGHARVGQNTVVGSMTILLSWLCWGACQEEVCLDPRFLCNLTLPRFSVELPTFKWQQRNWLFQQRFTSERTKFEKELEQKYKILEDINGAVAAILTHSQSVVVGHIKEVPPQQQIAEIEDYNKAVMKWETDFRIYVIR